MVEIGTGETVGCPVHEADDAAGRKLVPALVAGRRPPSPEHDDAARDRYQWSPMWQVAPKISAGYTPRMSKILVSLPDDLVERIDRQARAHGSTRSRFLQEAALRQLGWPSHGTLEAALGRGRAALAGSGSFESADVVHAQRLARDARDRRR